MQHNNSHGTAEANSVVDLYIDRKHKQSTNADKNGNYKFKLDRLYKDWNRN